MPPNTYCYVFKQLVSKKTDYERVNCAEPTAETYWFQRLSIALCKGNAYKLEILSSLTC